ncbi:hypothetical protein [Rhodococcus sp. NPDC059234]|uniref:hypothetical protein n=1 Tax=Rhodococcus sp. NPDC059234 TaxID=3346781 RepID=UPI00366F5588
MSEFHADRVLLRSSTTGSVVSIDEPVDEPHTSFADEQPAAGVECAVVIDRGVGVHAAQQVGIVRIPLGVQLRQNSSGHGGPSGG